MIQSGIKLTLNSAKLSRISWLSTATKLLSGKAVRMQNLSLLISVESRKEGKEQVAQLLVDLKMLKLTYWLKLRRKPLMLNLNLNM